MAIYKRVSKKSKNGYKYQVNFQYIDRYGRKKRYTKDGFDTKKQASIHETMKKEEFKNGIYIDEGKTFDDVFNEYIDSLNLRDSTINNRKGIYSRIIKNRIGDIQINKLDFNILQNLMNDIGKMYSYNTCKVVKSIINLVLVYGYNLSYIKRMPYSRLKISGITKNKNKTITLEQFDQLIDSLSHPTINKKVTYDSYKIMLYIGLYTGLRLAEVLALNRSDLDLQKNTVSISKQFHKQIEHYTKSNASTAIVPIPKELSNLLKEHFKRYPKTSLVCFDKNYNYLSYKSAVDKCFKLGKKNGFHFHFHMLRHMFVTQAVRKKIDVKTVQMLARHANIQTTMDVYTNLEECDFLGITNNLYN